MNALIQDLRYGLRQLSGNPGFAATVVFTLALAIGANTAIFSVVNALLLKSLPYSHPERIGTIFTRISGTLASDERHNIDGEQWELLRDNVPALISAVSGARTSGANLEAASHVLYVQNGRVSAHYFDVLSIHAIMGRNFSEAEDLPHGLKTAVLSHDLWRNTFGADPHILGQSILLRGEPYTVIGVLPENATTPLNADVYTALQPSRQGEGTGTNFECITRLRDGATWQVADAQINRAWLNRSHRYEVGDNSGAQLTYYSVPLQQGQAATLRPQALALMLAAGFILLIACANLAALALVRVVRRTTEVATRIALGASPWQIQKQLWLENLLLAVGGGTLGVGVAFGALRGLLRLLPEHFLPVSDVSLDIRVLAFAALTSLATSVLFGMLAAWQTRRLDLRSAIAKRTSGGSERLHLRQVLVTGEVALTVLLLAAAGLLVRTLARLETLPPGFNPQGVMTAKASLDDVRYQDAAAFRKLLSETTEAMRHIPGVEGAAVGLSLPYEPVLNTGGIIIADGKEAGRDVVADEVYVTPDYFSVLQIPLRAGRVFSASDGPDAQRVAVVNQAFVRKFFHGENPLGRHLTNDGTIIGVVSDVAVAPGLGDYFVPLSSEETIYVPAAQVEARQLGLVHVWFQPSWIVRTSGPIEGLTAQMQRALASVDPNLPFSGFYRMNDLLAKTLATQRIEVALLTTMAALALVLSAVGILGLVANLVTQRAREIAIRIALGSTTVQAMIQVGLPGVQASALGLVLGLMCSAGLLRLMRGLLFGIGVYDPPTTVSVVLILAFIVLIASTVPTLRIARIDPAETLREE